MAGCHSVFVKSLLTASVCIVMFHFFNIIFKNRIRKLVKSKSPTLRYVREYSESTYVTPREQRTENLRRGAPSGDISTGESGEHRF